MFYGCGIFKGYLFFDISKPKISYKSPHPVRNGFLAFLLSLKLAGSSLLNHTLASIFGLATNTNEDGYRKVAWKIMSLKSTLSGKEQ